MRYLDRWCSRVCGGMLCQCSTRCIRCLPVSRFLFLPMGRGPEMAGITANPFDLLVLSYAFLRRTEVTGHGTRCVRAIIKPSVLVVASLHGDSSSTSSSSSCLAPRIVKGSYGVATTVRTNMHRNLRPYKENSHMCSSSSIRASHLPQHKRG
ncbi:hypothetical protein PISMIDRAFT_528906 [Pisolithus microcarpus 441]|uniref:Uncharacterized protein n=1 Tax=Pisolithus microcarpus 441 TaxID=765257 RepID=A0A0C9Z7Q7_9AGAM|nr:hypothetical protein PISMIDRAFT_528906 [Pisolithus microcarpus 441]